MATQTRAMDDLWRLTMENSPIGMAIESLTGEILTVNHALCEMLGYDAETLTGLHYRDITHPDDLAETQEMLERALSGEIGPYRIAKRYIRADGSAVIGELSMALLRDAEGAPIHFIKQIMDRTERHVFTERLEAAETMVELARARAEAVFEAADVGLMLADLEGRRIAHNQRHQEQLELAFPGGHDGLPGQVGFIWTEDQSRRLEAHELPSVFAAEGATFEGRIVWLGEDPATRRAVSVNSRPVVASTGEVVGAAVSTHDITDLLRATHAKDDFISNISHELRTPLTSALAYLELLGDDLVDHPEARHHAGAAHRNVVRLSHMVADLIFTTRSSSSTTTLDRHRVDIVRELNEAVAAARSSSAGVELTVHHPEAVEIVADGLRVRHVLDNLIANAILHGRPDGHVEVTLTELDAGIMITVVDDGEGIDADELESVFDRFHRGRNAHRRQVTGMGLGLHIVRTIVDAHGGDVSIASVPGEGTTVRVTLPTPAV